MPYQSKTYSLSDEVIAAIEQAREQGETPNKFLRRVIGIDKSDVVVLQREQRPTFRREGTTPHRSRRKRDDPSRARERI